MDFIDVLKKILQGTLLLLFWRLMEWFIDRSLTVLPLSHQNIMRRVFQHVREFHGVVIALLVLSFSAWALYVNVWR